MKTILFGNGLNLLNGYSTWKDLLERIDDKDDDTKIPNILQYEAEILPTPFKQKKVVTIEGEPVYFDKEPIIWSIGTETKLKTNIADEMKKYRSNEIYQRIASMQDITHMMTTNYDDVMKQTLEGYGYKETMHVKTENTYSIRRQIVLDRGGGSQKNIWNIHGEISVPQTIMLGLHQYCGSVSRISDYLAGKYSFKKGKETITIPKIQERLREGVEKPSSWIDLFFVSDVYIMGFSLLYEEIDLWWVLTRRKRLIRQGNPISNNIFFCGKVSPGKRRLLNIMDVDVIEPDSKIDDDDFWGQYHSILDKIDGM